MVSQAHVTGGGTRTTTFEDLCDQEFGRVFRAVYLLVGSREVAEDAVQEAFARALARWSRLSDEPWVGGWVMTTALNVARRQMRREPMEAPTSESSPDWGELVDIRHAVQQLPRRQQTAVILYYFMQLPISEVAACMKCRTGTVKAHLSKARRRLAMLLSETSFPDHDERGARD